MGRCLVAALVSMLAACSQPARRDPTAPNAPTGAPTTATAPASAPPASGDCPSLQIKAPDSLSQGSPAHVQVILAGGGDAATLRWSVSAGTITTGQGTRAIAIDTRGLAGSSITATVALGNLPAQCETTTASATTLIGP